MNVFVQIVILLVVLACMIMVLLAIRHLSHFEDFDNVQETDLLKEEVERDGHILSKSNIFSTLVESNSDEESKEEL